MDDKTGDKELIQENNISLRRLDVVFVIDSTESMDPFIEEVRNRILHIMKEIESTEIKPLVDFGIIVYGDHTSPKTNPTRSFRLTSDHEKISVNVHSLPRISGGFDYSEAVADGLKEAVDMAWHNGSHRVIILVGDAPPHGFTSNPHDMVYDARKNSYYHSDCFPDGCPCGCDPLQEATRAKEKGIIIYTVGVNARPDVKKSFQIIAKASDGTYLCLNEAAKLPRLISDLLTNEVQKMQTDIRTLEIAQKTRIYSSEYLGSVFGLPKEDIAQSVERLKKRGHILSTEDSGRSQSIQCSGCDSINFSSANFCRHCGKTLRSR
jgi:hypothetical protein